MRLALFDIWNLFEIWCLGFVICARPVGLLDPAAAFIFDLPSLAAAATNPAAVFIAPLAGVAGEAGMLFGCLPVILRDVDLAG